MEDSDRELRLFVVETDDGALARATEIVAALGRRRPVGGKSPEWSVVYRGVEVGEALALCKQDLHRIDPGWEKVLDFAATASEPLSEVEFS